MKARRKGTDNPFTEVYMVQLEGIDILYKADLIEFKHDTLSTELKTYDQIEEEKHWRDVRERAAIAAMQGLLSNPSRTGSAEECAKAAIDHANTLIEKLKKK